MGATIRHFRASDAHALALLTVAAIRVTGKRAYSSDQIAAWAARHTDPQRFITRANDGAAILVATNSDDNPVAYVLTEPNGHCDMLYCHPDHARCGHSLRLLAAAEILARSQGAARLFTEASELARPVFERAGFALLHRRDFIIEHGGRGVAIHNYAMAKPLS